jgi:hypothetical protein
MHAFHHVESLALIAKSTVEAGLLALDVEQSLVVRGPCGAK